MILYIFISCQKRFPESYERIIKMMLPFNNDYLIVKGGSDKNYYNENSHILELDCNDFYEGLPEKVLKTYKFIYNNKIFNKYNFICKLDDDMILHKIFDNDILSDYCGIIQKTTGNRNWHIGKCSKESKFNTKPYDGIYVPWCKGGYGYILSRFAIENLINNTEYFDEIYEDVYIAKILYERIIFPKHLSGLSKYISSPDHKC
jgi:hypothetical protein